MKAQKIKEERKKNKLTFLLEDSDEVFANTIRRLILEEVPTLAVEEVEFKENSSALYDEMLALRMGLVPIKTDLSSYQLPASPQEIEEKSARCTLQIKIKANKKGYVYAEEAESSDPKCTFVYPKMPITKLLAKQKIDAIMTAVMGQGKEHTKWSPGLVYYKKEPVVKLGKVSDPQKIAEASSDGVFTLKGNKLELNEDKIYDSNLLEYYSELDSGIKVEYTDKLIFVVESWGQLSCKEMLEKSAEIFLDKIAAMEKMI